MIFLWGGVVAVFMDTADSNISNKILSVKKSIENQAVGTSVWVLVPAGVKSVNFDLVISSGAGYVEVTSDFEGAKADTATGIQWDLGAVNSTSQRRAEGIAAFRLVVTAGNCSLFSYGIS